MIEHRLHVATYSEVDANGFIGIQFDAFGEQESGMEAVELQHPFGFRSRPRDPDGEFGCNVQVGWEGTQAHAWLGLDPRYIKLVPQDKRGGSTQYCVAKSSVNASGVSGGVSFSTLDGDTGAYTLYVPEFSGASVSGAYCITVDPATRAIQIVHPEGFAVVLSADGIQMRGDASTWLKLGKGVFEVVAASIKLRGIVAVGASTESAIPLLPGVASQPCPSFFLSPT